jgi:hypothetical protein
LQAYFVSQLKEKRALVLIALRQPQHKSKHFFQTLWNAFEPRPLLVECLRNAFELNACVMNAWNACGMLLSQVLFSVSKGLHAPEVEAISFKHG